MKPIPNRYFLLYGGPIGDSLVGIHVGRTLAANVPGAVLELVSTRENAFVRELCRDLPFIRYRSLPKESPASWVAIVMLAFTRYSSFAYEPVATAMSPWWRLILWFARRHPGSIQLFYQVRGFERPVPRGVLQRVFDREHESFFDTPKTVLEAWGIEGRNLPRPSLPMQPAPSIEPYLLFHFFAGQVRRSIPADHARAILEAARAAYPRHTLVVTCSNSERERAERIITGISGARIESGHTPRELIALLCGAGLVVGTASGILILAAHLDCPVISLSNRSNRKSFQTDFSPETTILTSQKECRCYQGDGSACQFLTEEGPVYRCLYFITTQEVLTAMKQKLPEYS